MKVRELLMKMEGACSYRFYTRSGKILNASPDTYEIMSYLDDTVNRFRVEIHDVNTDGMKQIRCCIYLEPTAINSEIK